MQDFAVYVLKKKKKEKGKDVCSVKECSTGEPLEKRSNKKYAQRSLQIQPYPERKRTKHVAR